MVEETGALAPLPANVRLLHIGPHKTGTTTVQAAFHQNRDALDRAGIHYAGRGSQPMTAAMAAALGNDLPGAAPGAGLQAWQRLLDEIRQAEAPRAVISSEFFCEASSDRVRAIVEDLDPARLHVVVTLRPLARILASQWQQYMQNRPALRYDDSMGYEDWLAAVLATPPRTDVTPSFWRRHRHGEVVRRWAEAVGPDRLTVVAVDDDDRGMLPDVFERMLDLPAGVLTPRDLGANRSLTAPEIALLQRFNADWVDRGWSKADYTRLVRFGAVRHLQARAPGEGEGRLLTPAWAIERSAAIGADAADEIAGLGVRVVGDLAILGDPTLARAVGSSPVLERVPTDLVARLAGGGIRALAELPWQPIPPERDAGEIERAARADKRGRRALTHLAHNTARVERSRRALEQPAAGEASAARVARAIAGKVRRRLRPPPPPPAAGPGRRVSSPPQPQADQPASSPETSPQTSQRAAEARHGSRTERRRARREATLLEVVDGARTVALVGVAAGDDAFVDLVRTRVAANSGHVIVVERGLTASARHVRLVAEGPFDVLVDLGALRTRRTTLLDCFYHLRPHGTYVVGLPVDLDDPSSGTFGELIARAIGTLESPSDPGRSGSAEKDIRGLAAGVGDVEKRRGFLCVTRSSAPALAKMREPEMNALAQLVPGGGVRLLDVVEAPELEPLGQLREGREAGTIQTPRLKQPPARSIREYSDVVVSPGQVVVGGRSVLTPDTFRHNARRRLSNDWINDLAPRFGSVRYAEEEITDLPGTYFHLDNEIRGHFGHLMTEQMSRFWGWEPVLERWPDAKAIVSANPRRPELLDYELEIYRAAGIATSALHLIDGPVRVERLVGVSPLFSNPQYVDPMIAETWRKVGDSLAAQAVGGPRPRRIFCSRRIAKRSCRNIETVESEFVRAGFDVIFPEDHSLGDQVELFRAADVVAGFGGSGMFGLCFATSPKRVVTVSSETYTARNEYLIAAVLGHEVDAVKCAADDPKTFQSSFWYDAEREGAYLRSVLDELR